MKLTPRERKPGREPREVLPFPTEAARSLRKTAGKPDRAACDAARKVEAAMAEVERRFQRLRLLIDDTPGDDGDRPRAA
jgi:hypothetical protein